MNRYGRERKAEAVILQASDIFDADRTYICFTDSLGKIRARAKGVRKLHSRLAGHLLEYLPTNLEVVESDGWFLIVQAQVSQNPNYPRHALPFLQHAELLAEGIDQLLPAKEPHPELYGGLVYTLERLRALCESNDLPESQQLSLLVGEYLFKMMIVLGYQPELERCVMTDRSLEESKVAWSSQLGGVVNWEPGMTQGGVLRLSSPKTVVALRQLARPQFVVERLAMPVEVRQEAAMVIFDYVQTVVGKPLKSYAILPRLEP